MLSENLRTLVTRIVEENHLEEDAIRQLTSGIQIMYFDETMESYVLSEFLPVLNSYRKLTLDWIPRQCSLAMNPFP
jgi:hypothetical protein